MASMTRTIARNIARERMASAGVKHCNRKGQAVTTHNHEIKRSKAFKQTLTSLFALNWRAFLADSAKPSKRKPRESRKPFFTRKVKEA